MRMKELGKILIFLLIFHFTFPARSEEVIIDLGKEFAKEGKKGQEEEVEEVININEIIIDIERKNEIVPSPQVQNPQNQFRQQEKPPVDQRRQLTPEEQMVVVRMTFFTICLFVGAVLFYAASRGAEMPEVSEVEDP